MKYKRILKKILIALLYILFSLSVCAFAVYLYLGGEFGAAPSDTEETAYAQLDCYSEGRFQSPKKLEFHFDRVSDGRRSVFWSGDTGYGSHFARFKEAYGPFDLAAIEIDGWNEGWPSSHLFPNEAAQAAKDLGATEILPIHWGAYDLAIHPWHESIDTFLEKTKTQNIKVLTPQMGERMVPGETITKVWWK